MVASRTHFDHSESIEIPTMGAALPLLYYFCYQFITLSTFSSLSGFVIHSLVVNNDSNVLWSAVKWKKPKKVKKLIRVVSNKVMVM